MGDLLRHFVLFCIFGSICFTGAVNGERTKDKMYETIEGTAACFRRLNGTHEFGCTSSRNGNVGVIHIVKTAEDQKWLIEVSNAGPYMVVLYPDMFKRPVLLSLKLSQKVSGVILADVARPLDYSPEDSCPNRYSGLSSLEVQTCNDTNPVNPWGSSLLLENWGFPIFHVDDKETIGDIEKCFEKNNNFDMLNQKSRSLCAMEMNAYMYAAVDSPTCIRRTNMLTNFKETRFCDPLGDLNIWSSLFPRSKKNTSSNVEGSTLVLASRMDATSMFDYLVPGAVSPTTAIVTLLATADALSKMIPQEQASQIEGNVMFILFHGESYDYIGSSRVVYDMSQGVWPPGKDVAPFKMNDTKVMLELGQISLKNPMFVHSVTQSPEQKAFLLELTATLQESGIEVRKSTASHLPPASLQSFLKEQPDFPGLLVTDHDTQYTNKFYNSIYDDADNLGFQYNNGSTVPDDSIQNLISRMSLALAKTFYNTLTGKKYTGSAEANITLINELLHCYLDNINCTTFRAVTGAGQGLPDEPASHYVGVSNNFNLLTVLTAQTLAFLTGEKTNLTEDLCKTNSSSAVWQMNWVRGYTSGEVNDTGVCVKSTVNYSPAVSPAFSIDDYSWTSGQYSTWTESIWQHFTVRMFLKASPSQEAVTLSIGATITVLSFLTMFFVQKKSDALFGNTAGMAAAL